ncbi:MAG: aminotransferase class III-fold pyridoxal phosphate-dependent enzyme [Gemmatimonadales bacterium]
MPPAEEGRLAALLHELMPWLEQVRFLKTGAEAVAAAVRLARVVTGRDQVLGAGYHGWLDWCSRDAGVPAAIEGLFGELPFNDVARGRQAIAARGSSLAAVVVEPVVDGAPSVEWLTMLREETSRVGAVLVFDEIKTGLRIALGGAAERWGVRPDLVVLGKALANGFPLALVGGRREVMEAVSRTWISSTLATESVALSAAIATVEAARREALPAHLGRRRPAARGLRAPGRSARRAGSRPRASPRCAISASTIPRTEGASRDSASRGGSSSSEAPTTSSRWRTVRRRSSGSSPSSTKRSPERSHADRHPRPFLPPRQRSRGLAGAERQPSPGGRAGRDPLARGVDPGQLGPELADLLPVARRRDRGQRRRCSR